jgi:hypothetical protein
MLGTGRSFIAAGSRRASPRDSSSGEGSTVLGACSPGTSLCASTAGCFAPTKGKSWGSISTSGMTRTAKTGIGRMNSSATRRTVTPQLAFVTNCTITKNRLPSARLRVTRKPKRYENAKRSRSNWYPYAAPPRPRAPTAAAIFHAPAQRDFAGMR